MRELSWNINTQAIFFPAIFFVERESDLYCLINILLSLLSRRIQDKKEGL